MTKRVGVIGANPRRGWAGATHVPAIIAAQGLQLVAVGTSSQESAAKGAREWGVRGHADPLSLVADADVEVVVVAVKALDHAPLVEAALRAGKPVLCEWPLGRSLDETRGLAGLARTLGVPTAIGPQGRASPWVLGVRRMLAEGWLGEVRSVSLTAWDLFSTGNISAANAYMLDPANGATPLPIMSGHTLDTLFQMVGETEAFTAATATTVPWVAIEGGDRVAARSPDQIVLAGTLESGAALSAHVRAGKGPDETVRIEVAGSEGFLRVVAHKGYVHWGALDIQGRRGDAALASVAPPHDLGDPTLAAAAVATHNVAYLYEAFAKALDGGAGVADFADALARHETIDRVGRGG